MTNKQKRFIEEYITDLNATQAAIRAGYSKKIARQVGNINMSKYDIKKEIDKLLEEKKKPVKLQAMTYLMLLLMLGLIKRLQPGKAGK